MTRIGGWWRLWIVASVLLGALTWLATSQTRDIYSTRSYMTESEAREWVQDQGLRAKACDIAGLPRVSASPDDRGYYAGSFSCTSDRQYILSFIYALIPAALLAAIGLTCRWVWRGFRGTD